MRGEFAENVHRKDFTLTAVDAIWRAAEPLEKAAAKQRQREHGGTAPGKHSAKVSRSVGGRAVDRAGAFAGVSGRTVEKVREVVDAARADPEKFGYLVEEMDRTNKVGGVYRKPRQARDEQRLQSLVPVKGRFKTLIVDPPWDYDWLSLAGRAASGYATMR